MPLSLTSLIQSREVATRLDLIIPEYPRRVFSNQYVLPRADRHRRSVVGTAFDYALRFELQRLNPHAIDKPWVAESAQRVLEANYQYRLHGVGQHQDDRSRIVAYYRQPRRWFRRIVEEAREFHRRFIRRRRAGPRSLRDLATHALRLAALDPYYRALYLELRPHAVNGAEVEEIVELLQLVPIAQFCHPQVVMLNPTFGALSHLVGGADADLICGDRLIDLKTVAVGKVEREYVRQLVGYLLLARRARQLGAPIPELRSLCIYFSRHGVFWSMPVAEIVDRPRFRSTERWLMQHIGFFSAHREGAGRGTRSPPRRESPPRSRRAGPSAPRS